MSRSTGILRGRRVEEHIRIDDDGHAVRVLDVHERYGGFDFGAALSGMLAALGVTVLLGGVLGGIGTIGYQLDVERGTDTLSAGGLAGGLVTLLVAFLIGGYIAGRMGRYDGGRNGVMTAVLFILVAAVLAALGGWLGDRYNAFNEIQVPRWFDENATTTTAIITGVVAAVVMIGAGFLGGILGARYHARADAYLAAEQRDRMTGGERLETFDADGHRHVTAEGPALATVPADDRERSAVGASNVSSTPASDRRVDDTRGETDGPLAGDGNHEAAAAAIAERRQRDETTAEAEPRRDRS